MIPLAVLDAAAPVSRALPDSPLFEAIERWSLEPWRIAFVGRVSAGKSSLVNRLTGAAVAPIGLGGVTEDAAEYAWGRACLVDTPGIDDERSAVDRLGPLVPGCDAIVWVVDGLQPVTGTERRVLTSVRAGLPLRVIVSKFDLIEPAEHDSVIARVAHVTGVPPVGVDLRRALSADLAQALLDAAPTPRRREALTRALLDTAERLRAQPDPDEELRAVRSAWREALRALERKLDDGIRSGRIDNRAAALRELSARFAATRAAFVESLTARLPDLPPRLPGLLPDFRGADRTLVREAVSALAGQEGALRTVRSELGRLASDGDAALEEWLSTELEAGQTRSGALRAVELALRAV